MALPLAYCTNVHAGPDLTRAVDNLRRHAVEVKRRHSPDAPMGVGLWLAAEGARECVRGGRIEYLRDWLAEHGLVPFTFNGFPYGDFHQPVVKHAVYEPAWWHPARVGYTLDLVTVLDGVLPPGMKGSLSTVPVAWGKHHRPELLTLAGRNLARIGQYLSTLGRPLILCIEPEPGCLMDTAADVVRFFEAYVWPAGDERVLRRHLGVCHDVCHAAVMYEDQRDVIRAYRAAGIAVGKVQVSSAVGLTSPDDEALAQLRSFVEPRYLHQTVTQPGGTFYEDLPDALVAPTAAEYRTHFHVPIYLRRFGRLDALQQPILDCLDELRPGECEHFEVETYAWGVLPPELQVSELAEGIAREMDWLRGRMPAGMLDGGGS